MDFITLHVDTANGSRDSVCRIKIVEVKNNQIKNEFVELIKPPKQHSFEEMNIRIHGINEEKVKNCEEFPSVIQKYNSLLNDSIVFVSNSSFHMSALRHMYDYYGIEYPNFQFICNTVLAKNILPHIGIFQTEYLLRHFKIVSKQCKEALLTIEIIKDLDQNNIIESISKSGIIIGEFESPDHFKPSVVKKVHKKRDDIYGLKDIIYDESKHKPDSPFYLSTVVFTGSLKSMLRKDALKIIAEIGGYPSDNLTTQTNYLICGDEDLENISPESMTGKYKKAISFANKGFDIEIVNESFFLEHINQ